MTGPTPSGLELRDFSVRYGPHLAVSGVTVSVAPGEVLALAGPNGSGKSTLIRAVATRTSGVSGFAAVDGARLDGLSAVERARRVAWMPQEEPTGDNVALTDYVEYGRYAHIPRWTGASPADRAAVREAIREADLERFADRGLLELSGGERQRARLARALAQDAPVLLLDEPTAHLDVGHQLELLERVRAHARRQDRAVLVALHDLNLAARYADRVAVLAHGRLQTVGPPLEILSPDLLADVWGVVAELRNDPTSGLPYLIPRLPRAPRVAPPGAPSSFRVHVVGGGGSGGPLFRGILDLGCDVSAGILPLFDSDTELARELGLAAAVELPFRPIASETLERLDSLLASADAIVVAPFPVGASNLANLDHLAGWVGRRPTLLVDHPEGPVWDYADGRGTVALERLRGLGAERARDVAAAVEWVRERRLRPATPAAR